MPWAGARSAASPISSPPIWPSRPRTSTGSAASGRRRGWQRARAPRRCSMFDAIARGEIKALWVMATNPAVSLPRASHVREALGRLELFVVSDNVLANDTVKAGAHVLLPAARLGREGRHRHQFGAANFAPAGFSVRAGRDKARLVDRDAGRAANGVRRGVLLSLRRAHLSRACGALRLRERRPARLRSRRPRGYQRRRVRCARSRAMAVARRRRPACTQGPAVLRRRRILYARP